MTILASHAKRPARRLGVGLVPIILLAVLQIGCPDFGGPSDRLRGMKSGHRLLDVARAIESAGLPDLPRGKAGTVAELAGSLGLGDVPLTDDWDHPLLFESQGAKELTLTSLGSDGVRGPIETVAHPPGHYDYARDIIVSVGPSGYRVTHEWSGPVNVR